jgi:hypothetical protein
MFMRVLPRLVSTCDVFLQVATVHDDRGSTNAENGGQAGSSDDTRKSNRHRGGRLGLTLEKLALLRFFT